MVLAGAAALVAADIWFQAIVRPSYALYAWVALSLFIYSGKLRQLLLSDRRPKTVVIPVAVFGGLVGFAIVIGVGRWTDRQVREVSVERLEEKVDELPAEIARLIGPAATVAGQLRLLQKYPLGFVIFGLDYRNAVLPYQDRLLDEYEIDWRNGWLQRTNARPNRAEATRPLSKG